MIYRAIKIKDRNYIALCTAFLNICPHVLAWLQSPGGDLKYWGHVPRDPLTIYVKFALLATLTKLLSERGTSLETLCTYVREYYYWILNTKLTSDIRYTAEQS